MTTPRRIQVIYAFILVWMAAVTAQLVTVTLLGHYVVTVTHPFIPAIVFCFGICCQILFQGPSRTETANIVYRKSLGAAEEIRAELYTIDRIYLAFIRDRAIRVVVVTGLVSTVWIFVGVLRGQSRTLLLVLLAFAALTLIRIFLIHWRVKCRRFGTNETEARQLLAFLAELYKKDDGGFDPPGKIKKSPDPLTEPAVHPLSAAEYAR